MLSGKSYQRKRKGPFRLLFSLLVFFLLPAAGIFPQGSGAPGDSLVGSEACAFSRRDSILEKINLLALYTVVGGKRHIMTYQKEDLRSGRGLEVEGYVSGVVVLCNDLVEANLDGIRMSRIRENQDGTLVCKYFGPLRSAKSIFPYIDQVISRAPATAVQRGKDTPKYLLGGYSYFPKVLGSAVSGKDRFVICLKKGDAWARIPVRQQDRTTYTFRQGTGEEMIFRYRGNSLEDRFDEIPDLRQRLAAVCDGIRSVENRFDLDLVTRVNLVDYEEIRNAVTQEGGKEIWFYIRAIEEEPLAELKTIAEHETLHLLVDRQEFADSGELLEHFADLKGFDILSYERFMLITRGVVPEMDGRNPKEDTVFFAFINERNFLEGMKGGHSHQNPDEFCTSFLHSLMFVERLEENLDRPLDLVGHQTPYFLSSEEKGMVLDAYIKTIDILQRSVSHKETLSGAGRVRSLLENAHFRTRRTLKKSTSLAESRPPAEGRRPPAF